MNTSNADRAHLLRLIQSLMQEMGGTWTADFKQLDELQEKPAIVLNMKAGDIHFSLVHSNEPESSKRVLIECRFGKVPPASEQAAFAQLLDLNYQASPFSATAFAIDESTEEVMGTHVCPIEGLTARDLYTSMSGMAELARLWRDGFFLEEVGEASKGAPFPPASAQA